MSFTVDMSACPCCTAGCSCGGCTIAADLHFTVAGDADCSGTYALTKDTCVATSWVCAAGTPSCCWRYHGPIGSSCLDSITNKVNLFCCDGVLSLTDSTNTLWPRVSLTCTPTFQAVFTNAMAEWCCTGTTITVTL